MRWRTLTTINTRNPSRLQLQTTNRRAVQLIKEYLDQEYGSTNVAEFVAEAFTNPEFQSQLAPESTQTMATQSGEDYSCDV